MLKFKKKKFVFIRIIAVMGKYNLSVYLITQQMSLEVQKKEKKKKKINNNLFFR